ncbi:hypothetical protein ACTXL8_15080 [Glutamicibacter arilaitensis]|uniref:hypothetical protein n=1 Tax=Glutamicibacter arilaitensis TaxID=256701 RepID=UPI003FD35BB1
MSTERDALFQGIEGGAAPSQAGLEDTSVSDVSDRPTACHSGVQVEQQADSQVDTGRADAEAVRQSHGGAKRRRGSGGRLDTRFDDATLAALRTRAERLGLAPSTWVRAVVRDALHGARSEELDAAVAAHLPRVESRVQASADARELAAQVRPLAINVNDLDRRARAGEAVALSAEVSELIELLREVRALLGDRVAS